HPTLRLLPSQRHHDRGIPRRQSIRNLHIHLHHAFQQPRRVARILHRRRLPADRRGRQTRRRKLQNRSIENLPVHSRPTRLLPTHSRRTPPPRTPHIPQSETPRFPRMARIIHPARAVVVHHKHLSRP